MIADMHALTSVHNPKELIENRMEVAKDFLACGFDTDKGVLFVQSDIPEHTELAWILGCVAPKSLLERAVSYKDKVEQGIDASIGLFTYPVLQAADIVIYDADFVPTGKDQQQHIEMTRDIAEKFNQRYGKDLLKLPQTKIREEVAVVPGTDGRKMSKSYGNTIPIFGDEKVIKKAVMGMVTDSAGANDPKDPEKSAIFATHKLILSESDAGKLADEYKNGIPYGDAKKRLLEDLMDYFKPMREKREKLTDKKVKEVLESGKERAGKVAGSTMERVRPAIGL